MADGPGPAIKKSDMEAKEIFERIKDVMRKVSPEAKTILYGSYARGEQRLDSDIDLLILVPDSYKGRDFVRKKLDISGHLYDLSLEIGKDISTLVTVPKVFYARKTPFTINISNEGIEL